MPRPRSLSWQSKDDTAGPEHMGPRLREDNKGADERVTQPHRPQFQTFGDRVD